MERIPLTQDKFALVDDEDYEYLMQWKWCAIRGRHRWYAMRKSGARTLLMHRVVLDAPRRTPVDHINADGLDNRKCNLRLCTTGQNTQRGDFRTGKTGYRGVQCVAERRSKYRARMRGGNGGERWVGHLGFYATPEEAAMAYDEAMLWIYGEHAFTNFPKETYGPEAIGEAPTEEV